MGVRAWISGLVAAAVIAAVTASAAPIAPQPEATAKPALFQPKASSLLSELTENLADENVANTPHATKPDTVTYRWPCKLPMRIYYTGGPGIESQRVLRELAYPVRYLQNLGYDVKIVREIAYQYNYPVPTNAGDVLMVIATGSDVAKTELGPEEAWGVTEYNVAHQANVSSKVTINGKRGLPSDVLLHELGHVLGLGHKDYTVMTERTLSTGAFDPSETAAIDCRR